MTDPATSRPLDTHPHYDEFAAAFGDVRARGPIDYRRIEVVDPEMADVFRMKTPADRLGHLLDANCTVRELITVAIRNDHPDWNEAIVNSHVNKRMLNS